MGFNIYKSFGCGTIWGYIGAYVTWSTMKLPKFYVIGSFCKCLLAWIIFSSGLEGGVVTLVCRLGRIVSAPFKMVLINFRLSSKSFWNVPSVGGNNDVHISWGTMEPQDLCNWNPLLIFSFINFPIGVRRGFSWLRRNFTMPFPVFLIHLDFSFKAFWNVFLFLFSEINCISQIIYERCSLPLVVLGKSGLKKVLQLNDMLTWCRG